MPGAHPFGKTLIPIVWIAVAGRGGQWAEAEVLKKHSTKYDFGVPCVTFFGAVIDHGRAGCCK